jgi:hypothetical protein
MKKKNIVTGYQLILAERKRQIESEGHTPAHDDRWNDGGQLELRS